MNGKEFDLFYKITQQKINQLKLENLEKGFDSIQIRIWYDYSLVTQRKILVLKKIDSKYSAILYLFDVDWDYQNEKETITQKDIRVLNLNIDWGKFMKELSDLGIESLPNMDDIPGLFDGWTDGITYNIEIATMSKYRFYSYHVPEEFQDEFWQAKNIVKILSLIENEFGLNK